MENGLVGWLGASLENWWQQGLGKRYNSLKGQRIWEHLYPMLMLLKGWLEQKRILIIKLMAWPIPWLPVRVFPQHFCHYSVGPSSRDEGCTWDQQHGFLLSQAGLATAKCSVCRDQRRVPTWHCSLRWLASYPMAGWFYSIASIMEGVALPSSETDALDIDLSSLHTKLLSKLPSLDSGKKERESTSSETKEIFRPGWLRNRGFWPVDLMFK